ncbi:hypothetical protein [Nannocystis punicea]|uniref:Uncharacterized protein n=1 Tax=Nannocystis punicea TaxID=2995304 RepID=A0ABY7GX78_9BACT|nr:hypothetical protein [Nannocystis poenicansa]WAS91590.1 hypothetical protein O0S08_35870 [Nannocystis poenicansa]
MAHRKRNLNEPQTPIPLDPLRGRQFMRKDRASAIHATGDRVLTHGRRILATVGLHGASKWHVSDVALGMSPDPDAARIPLQLPAVKLTPGHFVHATLVANPSGMTAYTDPMGALVAGGAKGVVQIAVIYNNGADSGVLKQISIQGSGLPNAAQPTGPGAAWSQLYRRRVACLPDVDLNDPATLAAWSDGVTARIVVAYVGSPRALDLVIHEEPYGLAYDLAGGDWIAPMHSTGSGGNLGQLTRSVPVTKFAADDPGGGAEILCDAAARLNQEIGPVLFYASGWSESQQNFASTETDPRFVSGMTYTELASGLTTAFDAATSGWSVSSGANARRVQESEATTVLRDDDNVVPVRCYVYGRMTTSGPTATVRFETASYSIAQVPVPSGTAYAWRSAPGHLRCGLGAQDPTVVQVRAATSTGGGTFQWLYLVMVYEDV